MASRLIASAIVCTLGQRPVFRRCAQSILAQHLLPESFELIVALDSDVGGKGASIASRELFTEVGGNSIFTVALMLAPLVQNAIDS